MKVEIDPGAGPCFGVKRAIKTAEDILNKKNAVYCLGDIIHNEMEIERLGRLGLKTIHLKNMPNIASSHILFRAHGEPPASYSLARKLKKQIIDTTCPIVQKLQQQIEKTYHQTKQDTDQIVIFGNENHPEIISLQGHCAQNAIIVEQEHDLIKIDFTKPIHLFSQTTKYQSDYIQIKEQIEEQILKTGLQVPSQLYFHNSSCAIVAKRDKQLINFITEKDIIIFVSGTKSSNGKQLFNLCKNSNIQSYFISQPKQIQVSWFTNKENIGISGATSTPQWLLEETKQKILDLLRKKQ